MIKVTYICDKCQNETDLHDIYELVPSSPDPSLDVPADVVRMLGGKHICKQCLSYLFRNGSAVFKAKEKERDEDGLLIAKKNEHQETSIERDKRKTHYVSKKTYNTICEMYKDGNEIVDISDRLMVAMSEVSKVISAEGLGEERYKGQNIPNHGGVPIPQALPIVTKKGGGGS